MVETKTAGNQRPAEILTPQHHWKRQVQGRTAPSEGHISPVTAIPLLHHTQSTPHPSYWQNRSHSLPDQAILQRSLPAC